MSEMEDDAREYLVKIVWSITAVIVYMVINSSVGIMLGWFFFAGSPTKGNYIFYTWVLISTILLIKLLHKWWTKKYPHG
ncbi:MAG: hypothetical protein H7Y27_04350 [Gemmatimonadaceae bacterium]|nr:hypothetical protein [Chitinophagaceae bacterium]